MGIGKTALPKALAPAWPPKVSPNGGPLVATIRDPYFA